MQTQNLVFTEELIEYGKKHLLSHMRASGWDNAKIEAKITQMAMDNPIRAHVVQQFIDSLPEDQKFDATARMNKQEGILPSC